MTADRQAHSLTIGAAAALLGSGSLTSVELTQAVLARIEATEPDVHAYALVMADAALLAAEASDARRARQARIGPLDGIPMALKDLYYTAGVRTEGGSKVLAGFTPSRNATVTQRLLDGGAVIVGKTVTHEFACGTCGMGIPPTRNPWDLARTPGGSSAGSGAAVAADSCIAAMGTDTGGSVRMPASVNGVVGLKPTAGRISKHGVIPMSWSLDCCGTLTKSVEDAALLLNVLAGSDTADPSSWDEPVPDYTRDLHAGVEGLRVGVLGTQFLRGIHQSVQSAMEAALDQLAQLGAVRVEVAVPEIELAPYVGVGILVPEFASVHQRWLRHQPADYWEGTRSRLEVGELLSATQYLRAQRGRTLIKNAFRKVFTENRLDVIVAPTLVSHATLVDQRLLEFEDGNDELASRAFVRSTIPFTLAGLPALSVPCGFATHADDATIQRDLPIGMQIVGRPFDEATVLRVGSAYESATEWHERRPAL
jgi:aspartyl-tRNA(Asn)/glutamyl-tRNA(Gln) amidotransferase subunit A